MNYSKKQIEELYSISFDPSESKYDDIKLNIYNGHYHVNDTDNPILLNSQGIYYASIMIDFEKAKKYFILASEQGHSNANVNLGSLYCNIDDHAIAYKYYTKVFDNPYALHQLGHLFSQMDDDIYNTHYYNIYNTDKYATAEKYFNDSIKLKYYDSYIDLALLYKSVKNYDKALETAKLAIEKNISSAYSIIASIYYYIDNTNDAIQACDHIVNNDLKNSNAVLKILSTTHTNNKNYEMAEKYLKLLISKNDIDAYFQLVKLYIDTNRNDDAREILKIGTDLKITRCMVHLYKIYFIAGEYNLASDVLNKIDEYGEGEKLFNLASWIYEYQSDIHLAIKYWKLCIDRCSEYIKNNSESNIISRCMNNIGSSYNVLGNRLQGIEWYTMSIKNCTNSKYDLQFIAKNIKANSHSTEFYYIITENNLNLPDSIVSDILSDENVIKFKDLIKNNFISTCFVCYDDVKCVKMKCKNDICIKCLSIIFITNKCPYCRGCIVDD